ncbi:nucleotidyltransferase family protein [Trichloromonas sp.]|uniref:nucleotidyltransferase family protein n=1 Tax=Trichloromonas sp. TaxID=3069249 RepID=UPI002A37496D|nr:nucleotidyltransferase domain-containing protein [Trichloromonas sp.]
MNFGISDQSFSTLLKALQECHDVDEAILFGSRALGNFRPGSDIDIAVRGKKLSVRTAADLSTLLNEKLPLPYRFDIVHYDTINNADLKKHIDQVGVVIFRRPAPQTLSVDKKSGNR